MRLPPRGFWDHLEKPVPKTLYHYTSLSTMLAIIESKSLHASNILYLNDSTEFHHARRVIESRVARRLRSANSTLRPALRGLKRLLSDPITNPFYVSSFSKKSDDLSQWRGYAPAGEGVCIGFNSQMLLEAAKNVRADNETGAVFAALGRVISLSTNVDRSFDTFIDIACQNIDVVHDEAVKTVAVDRLVNIAAPFYKHDSFKDESEWRIVISANDSLESNLSIGFKLGKSTLVPFSKSLLDLTLQTIFRRLRWVHLLRWISL